MNGKKKGVLALWLSLLCIVLLATGTYAAYISRTSFKSVAVANQQKDDVRFSSNHLSKRPAGTMPLKIIAVNAQSTVAAMVTICNYPENTSELPHEGPITYTLTARLLDANGGELSDPGLRGALTINEKSFGENNTLSFENVTLAGGKPQQSFYRIQCKEGQMDVLDKISIAVTAKPSCTDGCDVKNNIWAARLRLVTITAESSWQGTFEDEVAYTDSTKVDAFNYVLTGTAQQTMRLRWDSRFVELGKWSQPDLPAHTIGEDEDGWKHTDLPLGEKTENGVVTSYRLQFYRTCKIPTGESWNAVKDYVTFAPVS